MDISEFYDSGNLKDLDYFKVKRSKSSIVPCSKSPYTIQNAKMRHDYPDLDIFDNSNTYKYNFLNENDAPPDMLYEDPNDILNFDDSEIGVPYINYITEPDEFPMESFPVDNDFAIISHSNRKTAHVPLDNRFNETKNVQTKHKPVNKRKATIGRPTLSSPSGDLISDHIYAYDKPPRNYQIENQNISQLQQSKIPRSNTKPALKRPYRSDMEERTVVRSKPRILTKPQVHDTFNENIDGRRTVDVKDNPKEQYMNKQFALNLINRAHRQGSRVDVNKIPVSIFQQNPQENFVVEDPNVLNTEVYYTTNQYDDYLAGPDQSINNYGNQNINSPYVPFNEPVINIPKSRSSRHINKSNLLNSTHSHILTQSPKPLAPVTSIDAATMRNKSISPSHNDQTNIVEPSELRTSQPQKTASSILLQKWRNQKH